MVATLVLELVHVPSVVGLAVMLAPTQTLVSEVLTVGGIQHSTSFTFTSIEEPIVCPEAVATTGTPLASTLPAKLCPLKSVFLKEEPPSTASVQASPSLSVSK